MFRRLIAVLNDAVIPRIHWTVTPFFRVATYCQIIVSDWQNLLAASRNRFPGLPRKALGLARAVDRRSPASVRLAEARRCRDMRRFTHPESFFLCLRQASKSNLPQRLCWRDRSARFPTQSLCWHRSGVASNLHCSHPIDRRSSPSISWNHFHFHHRMNFPHRVIFRRAPPV